MILFKKNLIFYSILMSCFCFVSISRTYAKQKIDQASPQQTPVTLDLSQTEPAKNNPIPEETAVSNNRNLTPQEADDQAYDNSDIESNETQGQTKTPSQKEESANEQISNSSDEVPAETLFDTKESWPVTYNEQVAFFFYTAHKNKDGSTRAKEAHRALAFAIEAKKPKSPDSPIADVVINKNTATLHVRGYTIALLHSGDAKVAGYTSLEEYANHVSILLEQFVPRQRFKAKLQNIFTKIFLSIFFAFLTFVALKQIKKIFFRFEETLEERGEKIKPLSVMSETLLSGDTISRFLTVGIALGRLLSYAIVIITAIGIIMGQFDFTRNLLYEALSSGTAQFFKGIEGLASLFPRLLLILFLIFLVGLSFKILDLFLKGVKTGKIQQNFIPRYRARAFKVMATVSLFFIFGSFIFASFFGDFSNPFETLLIIAGGVFVFSMTPVLMNSAVGVIFLWKSKIRPGDWVRIADMHGRVAQVDIDEVTLITLKGETLRVPMVRFAFNPIQHNRSPKLQISLEIKTNHTIEQSISFMDSVIDKRLDPRVHLVQMGSGVHKFLIVLTIPNGQLIQKNFLDLLLKLEEQNTEIISCQMIHPKME